MVSIGSSHHLSAVVAVAVRNASKSLTHTHTHTPVRDGEDYGCSDQLLWYRTGANPKDLIVNQSVNQSVNWWDGQLVFFF